MRLPSLSLCVTLYNSHNRCKTYNTSNVTGRHRAPNQKHRHYNGHHRGWLFSSSSVASRTFSVLCVYLTIGHHPHPLGYLCAKFCFFRGFHCWASIWRKSQTDSPAYLMPGNWSFRFGKQGLTKQGNFFFITVVLSTASDMHALGTHSVLIHCWLNSPAFIAFLAACSGLLYSIAVHLWKSSRLYRFFHSAILHE